MTEVVTERSNMNVGGTFSKYDMEEELILLRTDPHIKKEIR